MKNITEERMQILKMIEQGKITATEGLELMNALEQDTEEVSLTTSKKTKWIKIRVTTMEGRSKAKVNIPLSLVDIGLKLGAAYSPQLKESGLKNIDFKEIMEAVKNGAEGKILDVEDEENQEKVEIYVE
jgi:DUF4097 and DUF4098 domain-containing protein YvlB